MVGEDIVIQAISTMGFPIVMSLMIWRQFCKAGEATNIAIDNNTRILTELSTLIKEKLK